MPTDTSRECPKCLRAGVEHTVKETGHIKIRAGTIEISRGPRRTMTIEPQRVDIRTYRCSEGHQWSKTRVEAIHG